MLHSYRQRLTFALLCFGVTACVSEDRHGGIRQDVTDATVIDFDVQADVAPDTAPDVAADVHGDAEAGSACESDNDCASDHCLLSREGRTCAPLCAGTTGTPCPGERECLVVDGDRVCVDRFAALCLPCSEHSDCNLGAAAGVGLHGSNRCLAAADAGSGSGRYCGVACGGAFGECAEGSECSDGQCRPTRGICLCSGAAVALAAETTCSVLATDGGLCSGKRHCEAIDAEPTACDAAPPSQELCNGKDDDCDGVTDERPWLDCGDFACHGASGCAVACATTADCAPGLACDVNDRDGDSRIDECFATGDAGTSCTLSSQCDSEYCGNGFCCSNRADPTGEGAVCCAEDADCKALEGAASCSETTANGCLGVKTVGRCSEASICVGVQVPSSEGCVGQTCRGAQCLSAGVLDGVHLCDASGACVETADLPCDDGDPCTFDICNASGCRATPHSGTSAAACYTFAPETAGVGACHDGHVTCQNGGETGCGDEVGPATEVCNGVDDDCDGRTDEDTERACFPFLCDGQAGCLIACGGNADCAAGNFCSDKVCAGTGQNGAICAADSACQSGHCGGGVCCEAGLCCRANLDCASLDDVICDAASSSGCAGTRLSGVCGAGAMCETATRADASACDGEQCLASECSGDKLLPAATCAGSQCVRPAPLGCSPYACEAVECLDECLRDGECRHGASCNDGVCNDLPDGAACTSNEQCGSSHCGNGFCCHGEGLCCGGDDAACKALDGASTCKDAGECEGVKVVGQCRDDFRCAAETVPSDAACAGQTCGDSECVNLDGGVLVKEGIRRNQCDASGTCVSAVHDCRDAGAGSCTASSALFLTCNNCSSDRTTCVVLANPCYCE